MAPPMLLAGRVALASGAACGIGHVTALVLAEEGAGVAAADVLNEVEGVAAEVRARGRQAAIAVFDIADDGAVRAAHLDSRKNRRADRLGRVDRLSLAKQDYSMLATITAERPNIPDALLLIDELQTHLESFYPPESRHGFSVERLIKEGVAFFAQEAFFARTLDKSLYHPLLASADGRRGPREVIRPDDQTQIGMFADPFAHTPVEIILQANECGL